jgi:hypothetical protein
MIRFRGPQGPWEPVFAWKPVKDIHGRRHWLKKIYRRELNQYVWPPKGWEYGTGADFIIDALRN